MWATKQQCEDQKNAELATIAMNKIFTIAVSFPLTSLMTLGNMRENGVRSLAITCGALWCHHQAVLDVSGYADDVTVPAFGPRMVCTASGAIGADARPNWNGRAAITLFGRHT
jgi:hypothetical protein